jgi:thiamine-phosphate pyrophosphorylase
MPLDRSQLHPVMCLTQDGLPLSHLEQAVQLLAAGARWIQVRMKRATSGERLHTAGLIASLCRQYGAVCIINDDVDVAIAVDAHGVHLGKKDGSWREARAAIGQKMILGGTINNVEDAQRALQASCLDYVGVGPWRYTATKENLAPVLGRAGVAGLVAQLDGIPAWAIGGIDSGDVAEIHASGAVGVAVSSALYRAEQIKDNFDAFETAWRQALTL